MLLMIPVAGVIALLVGFVVDRIQVGGSGVWYGNDEPPEGFIGFWDKGHTVVQWPRPGRVEDIVIDGVTSKDLTADNVMYSDIVVSEVNAGSIRARSISSADMIADPDFPGMITTKQELAQRREEEK